MLEINKIHRGDATDLIKELDNNSIDCVITDPPYIVGASSNARKGTQSEGFMLEPFFREWLISIKRVLKDQGSVYVFCDWRTYPVMFKAFCNVMKVANCIVWDFGWIKAGLDYRYTHEFIVYLRNEDTPRIKDRGLSDVWRIKPINFTAERFHNTEKPVEIIRKMIENSTKEGDLVLDPFMGSGTTAVACKQMGRNYIGFEIEKEYLDIANKRLLDQKFQGTLLSHVGSTHK